MLNKSAQAGRHSMSDRGADLYETPPVAVAALQEAEPLPRVLWEPACGRGAIASLLHKAGHTVYATDLCDYGFGHTGIDFLMMKAAPKGVECIITNPPYSLAQQFIERALDLAPLVVMLLRLAFLESERRRVILEERGLARIHVFRNRLPMLHRDGWTGPRSSSAMAFAWYVWVRDYTGRPEINRISWKQPTGGRGVTTGEEL